jgi:hypothetical protein
LFQASESRKVDHCRVVAVVGSSERVHVPGSKFVCFYVEGRAPPELLIAKSDDQVVGCDASVATIPVPERVGAHEPVMEPYVEFVRYKDFTFYPGPRVGNEVPDCLSDHIGT